LRGLLLWGGSRGRRVEGKGMGRRGREGEGVERGERRGEGGKERGGDLLGQL